MDYITLKRNDGEVISKVDFTYASQGFEWVRKYTTIFQYMTSSNVVTMGEQKLRLRLDEVQISGRNDESIPSYKFDYYSGAPDSLFSASQCWLDPWGFIKSTSDTYRNDDFYDSQEAIEEQASLDTAWVLKRITYPTGGAVEYEYETDRYIVQYPEDDEAERFVNYMGGLRLTRQTIADSISGNPLVYEYGYGSISTELEDPDDRGPGFLSGNAITYGFRSGYTVNGVGLNYANDVHYPDVAIVLPDGSKRVRYFTCSFSGNGRGSAVNSRYEPIWHKITTGSDTFVANITSQEYANNYPLNFVFDNHGDNIFYSGSTPYGSGLAALQNEIKEFDDFYFPIDGGALRLKVLDNQWKRGHLVLEEFYSSNGKLISYNEFYYTSVPVETDSSVFKIGASQTAVLSTSGWMREDEERTFMKESDSEDTMYKVSEAQIEYNTTNGLQSQRTEYRNALDSGDGLRLTNYAYAFDSSGVSDSLMARNMLSQVYSMTVREDSDVESKVWKEWDETTAGYYAPSEEWVWVGANGVANDTNAPAAPTSEAIRILTYDEYDDYGNLLEMTDRLGNTTSGVWASEHDYAVLRSLTTDGLTTVYTYDDATLQLIARIDSLNQDTTRFEYDNLQRLIEVHNSDDELTTAYGYHFSRESGDTFDPDNPNYVTTTSFRSSSDSTRMTTYLDGLGRGVQTQVRDGVNDIVQHTVYDSLGRKYRVYRPFLRNTSHSYLPIANFADSLFEETIYEPNPLDRISYLVPFGSDTSHSLRYKYGVEQVEVGSPFYRYTQTKDENGNVGKEFLDGLGNRVLTHRYLSTNTIETSFTFDILGNLSKTTDPEDKLSEYKYDPRSQLIAKTSVDMDGDGDDLSADETISSPDVEYKYDSNGNLRFLQDANRKKGGEDLIFYQYDALNRLTLTGVATYDGIIPAWTNLDPDSTYDGTSGDTFENDSLWFDYLESKHVYDAEPLYGEEGVWADAFDPGTLTNLHGRLAASAYRHPHSDKWGYTYYSYDDNGNINLIVQDLPDTELGIKKIAYQYDRLGNVAKVTYQDNRADSFYLWREYDAVGRLQAIYGDTLDTKPNDPLVEYAYWPTGQIKTAEFMNGQTITYSLTDRAWVDMINVQDIFTMNLEYDYVGNIDSVSQVVDSDLDGSVDDETPYGYGFTYDAANRLIAGLATNSPATHVGYKYDLAGNILGLSRSSAATPSTSYSYYTGTNRLDHVTSLGHSSNNYVYDYNGNLKQDVSKGITAITYDHRNLPYRIDIQSDRFYFGYDANGNRVLKQTQ